MKRNYGTLLALAIAAFLLSITKVAIAKSDWLCTEEASQRAGNVIKSCGIGAGGDENVARRSAFENAKKEFGSICAVSSDCRGRAISVQPARTSCEKEANGYKCYRLIEFAIGEPVTDPPMKLSGSAIGDPEPQPGDETQSEMSKKLADPLSAKELAKFEPIDIDQNESFKPFYYRDIAQLPKIRVGMAKAKVFAKFGKPSSVRESRGTILVFYRDRPFCDGGRCSFRFDPRSGRVVEVSDFKYEYTEMLK